MDNTVTLGYSVDSTTGIPDDTDIAAALADAVCAQVEFWAEVGEANDVDGLAGTDVSLSGYSGARAPKIAPRAYRILQNAGLV